MTVYHGGPDTDIEASVRQTVPVSRLFFAWQFSKTSSRFFFSRDELKTTKGRPAAPTLYLISHRRHASSSMGKKSKRKGKKDKGNATAEKVTDC